MDLHIVKSTERHRRVHIGTVLMFALLILVLLVGSANAATIEEEFEVSQGESVPDDTTPPTLTLTCSPENPKNQAPNHK